MADDDKPIDGEIIPAGSSDKRGRNARSVTRTSGQTEQQRKEEDDEAKPYKDTLAFGLDWRGEDWGPTDDEKRMVSMLKFSGYTDEDVARVLTMSVESLHKYFKWEIENAKMMLIGELAGRAFKRARDGDATLTMFLLKTRGNGSFSEKAAAAGALGEALGRDEPDDKKRMELVGKVLDLLDGARKAKTKTKTDTAAKAETRPEKGNEL